MQSQRKSGQPGEVLLPWVPLETSYGGTHKQTGRVFTGEGGVWGSYSDFHLYFLRGGGIFGLI